EKPLPKKAARPHSLGASPSPNSPTELFLFTTGFAPAAEDKALAIGSLVQSNPTLAEADLRHLVPEVKQLSATSWQTLGDLAVQHAAYECPDAELFSAVRQNHRPGEHLVIIAARRPTRPR